MIQLHLKKDVSDIQNSNRGNYTVNCILGYKPHCIIKTQTNVVWGLIQLSLCIRSALSILYTVRFLMD